MTPVRAVVVIVALASLSLGPAGCEGPPFTHKVEQLLPCWPRCEEGPPAPAPSVDAGPVACTTDGDCDDENACTQDACLDGSCDNVLIDGDGDGHAPLSCGGDDCDDASPFVHPLFDEGPVGSLDCRDGIDNDCDGIVDLEEQACLQGACNERRWCWISPRPTGIQLAGVWMGGASDIWAVGAAGTVLHGDGVRVEQTATGTLTNLRAVWGAAPNAVWAVGDGGLILHWNGTAWIPQESGTATHDLHAVSGTSPTDVWAVGALGLVLHWDGTTWSAVESGTSQPLFGVYAAASDDAWFAGNGSTLLHWNGAAMDPFSCGVSTSILGLHGVGSNHIWAAGSGGAGVFCLWDGQAWSVRGESSGARVVHSTTTGDAWGFGLDGRIVRWNGSAWSGYVQAPAPTLEHLLAAWSNAEHDVWAVGSNGEMIHWDGSSWTSVRPELPESNDFTDVWGCAFNDVWISGGGGSQHYDLASLQGGAPALSALHGFACDDVYGVDPDGLAWHWDGSRWSSESTGAFAASGVSGESLGGTSGGDLWLLAGEGEVWHRDATAWTLAYTAPELLRSVFAVAADDVWVVGLNGFTAHYDGSQWLAVAGPALPDLEAVWASGPDDVWATGRAATWRWDGAQWSEVPGLPSEWAAMGLGATRIHGRSADDVWLLNVAGVVARWDGLTWTELPVGVSQELTAVFADPEGETWVVGRASTALRLFP